MLYPTLSDLISQRIKRKQPNLFNPFPTHIGSSSLSHGRVSKSSEALKCERIDRRGTCRFEEGENVKVANHHAVQHSVMLSLSKHGGLRLGLRRAQADAPLSISPNIIEEVRSIECFLKVRCRRRSERRVHCLRGMKPQGPGFCRRILRVEPVKSGELGPKAPPRFPWR